MAVKRVLARPGALEVKVIAIAREMRCKFERGTYMTKIMTRRLIVLTLLALLLVGCNSERGQMPDWLADLLGVSPRLQAPEGPQLLPTPTLVTDGPDVEQEQNPAAPTLPLESTATPVSGADGPPPAESGNETDPGGQESGPFAGTFAGTAQGHSGSSAMLQLELTQSGEQVQGTATLGDGLVINAGGLCGSFPIPGMRLNAGDQVTGRTLSTRTEVEVNGFEIPIELNVTLSPDGETMQAEATMYPPALCGNNPTVTATLERVDGP